MLKKVWIHINEEKPPNEISVRVKLNNDKIGRTEPGKVWKGTYFVCVPDGTGYEHLYYLLSDHIIFWEKEIEISEENYILMNKISKFLVSFEQQ